MRLRTDKFNKLLRSKKAFAFLALAACYIIMVDTNLEQRARTLEDHLEMTRELFSTDLGNGECEIGSIEDANPAPADATKTLLASYPGSGKKFTWTVIMALTNHEIADDWDFSTKLDDSPLTIKTSWPHKEGKWSWDKQMDQVLLLVRNPRWALPSYHNMRWELDYAKDWASSYLRIPYTYTDRPAVAMWENWRDDHYDTEIDRWSNFIDFWMQGGREVGAADVHDRCKYSEIDCYPKAVIDFDHFYTENPTSEFVKLGDVLEASDNVDLVSAQARVCVLDAVYDNPELHNAKRGKNNLRAQYRYSIAQLDKMFNRTIELKEKYESSANSVAQDLVSILDKYVVDNKAEYALEVSIFLEAFVADELGDFNCNNLAGVEKDVCVFMKKSSNHYAFFDDEFPGSFPYDQWLTERSILTRLYYANGGSTWTYNSGWLSDKDHCTWHGVTCSNDWHVTALALNDNNMSGADPTADLNAGLVNLETLNLSGNSFS